MKILECKERTSALLEDLIKIWEASVRATHHFLSDDEVKQIKEYVPQALQGIDKLAAAVDDGGCPLGFMGVENQVLEMLFLAPSARGRGIGRLMLEYGIEHYDVQYLTVNEQNPSAREFYEHMGFAVYKRSELDEQGNPYPILYMKR